MNRICTLGLTSGFGRQNDNDLCVTRTRLEKSFAYLERLEQERANGRDSVFGKLMEQRIIWRELIELEIQNLGREIRPISAVRPESEELPHG